MGTIAVRRTTAVLLAGVLAILAGYTVFARSAKAAVRPVQTTNHVVRDQPGGSHRPVVGSGVKYVRNADGSVTRTR